MEGPGTGLDRVHEELLRYLTTCAHLPMVGMVNGNWDHVGEANAEGAARFDAQMLRALDWREIETHTSFTKGPQRFAGPTLASLLEAVGADGATLTARAINDYTVKIPVAHADAHDVILAMEQNGKPMRIRDKGPIWVVYPLSADETVNKPFDREMIWQLDRIEVVE